MHCIGRQWKIFHELNLESKIQFYSTVTNELQVIKLIYRRFLHSIVCTYCLKCRPCITDVIFLSSVTSSATSAASGTCAATITIQPWGQKSTIFQQPAGNFWQRTLWVLKIWILLQNFPTMGDFQPNMKKNFGQKKTSSKKQLKRGSCPLPLKTPSMHTKHLSHYCLKNKEYVRC